MIKCFLAKSAVLAMLILLLGGPHALLGAENPNPPPSPVKLVFIHHSTGGNWLADPSMDQPSGGLGIALLNSNYFVSATNYGWGPDSIGDRTDIPNWPEWFTGPNSSAILNALYNENNQNAGDFGSWSRLSSNPGSENQIMMFKSCFPNSDLSGNTEDPPAAEPNDWALSVSNAKAVYNRLLTYFQSHQDKLFIVITAPPQNIGDYYQGDQTPEQRAANARAFNNWLVSTWLAGYSHQNVGVFDYFNVLTHPDNHHRLVAGAVEHSTSPQSINYAYYPENEGDSHPNSTGHRKATEEFVPLLNGYYNRWKATGPVIAAPIVTTGSATSVTSSAATLNGMVNPNGAATTCHFEYGASTAYGSATTGVSVGSGITEAPASAALTGLTPGKSYHYRLVAANSVGTSWGADQVLTTATDGATTTSRIQPSDLQYMGAFRLPQGSGGSDWTWSGNALTYRPDGDPAGPSDGYPGSLFGAGSDVHTMVSEISIPSPVISSTKKVSELNTATTLQPFTNIKGSLFGYLEIPQVGLCYLPAQGSQGTSKLHFCYGQHLQGFEASHGWCEPDLSNPQPAGAWILNGYTNYITNDYIFDIPKAWADQYTPGMYLATGRSREGPWSGRGPAMLAYGPWNDGNPPAQGAVIHSLKSLLLYGEQEEGTPEIVSDESRQMKWFQLSDHWRGAAWLTKGESGGLVFVGTKALNRSWYGFANGVEWPYDCVENVTCPPYPAFPYDQRGFWAEAYQPQMIFYDPADLADVAKGVKKTWEPQPYAMMDLTPYLFNPVIDHYRYKRDMLGEVAFDRANGLIYIMETMADEDEKSLVHVWKVKPRGDMNSDFKVTIEDAIIAIKVIAGLQAFSSASLGSADVNNDGKIGSQEAVYILQKLSGMR